MLSNQIREKKMCVRERGGVIAWSTLGPCRWEDLRRREESGKEFPPMDRKSELISSDSIDSTVVESPFRADWIAIRALSWSMSPKHQPLVIRVCMRVSEEDEVLAILAPLQQSAVFFELQYSIGSFWALFVELFWAYHWAN